VAVRIAARPRHCQPLLRKFLARLTTWQWRLLTRELRPPGARGTADPGWMTLEMGTVADSAANRG
jgi:hypothetical protein